MRNASDPPDPERPDRHGFTCQVCGHFTVTAVDGLFANPAVGSPQRFCTPACRQAAWRRRRAAVDEATPLQRHGGRTRNLRGQAPAGFAGDQPPTISTPQEVIIPSNPATNN